MTAVAKAAPAPIATPLLKWVGGKRQLIPELTKYIPPNFRRYHEPFLGGGALFFHLTASGLLSSDPKGVPSGLTASGRGAALPKGVPSVLTDCSLNDANEELITTYRAVQHDVEGVIRHLSTYEYESDFYYRMRARDPRERMASIVVAARMIYLNRCGFNGLYRVNRDGKFNVPFGRYTNPTICDAENLRACSAALAGVRIDSFDFTRTGDDARKDDLFYFDPPYVPVNATSNFTSYTSDLFVHADQERLRDLALRLKQRGCHVILSNSDTPSVRELYSDFEIHPVQARRNINSKASKRGAVGEVVIT